MDVDNPVDDPQFVKVLETCLKMVIAETKQKLNANIREIEKQKIMIRTQLDKRKQFKTKVTQTDKISVLNETLTILNVTIGETLETLEMAKANIDDQYKLNQMRIQEYQNITAEYEEIWNTYRTRYEEFPLAKTRNAIKINLQKLKIEHMIMNFKKTEMTMIIKRRVHIDWIRTRCKIIEFAAVMVERLKLEKKLMKLKVNVDYYGRELQSIEMELQMLRKNEEDQRQLRKQKVLDMGPPKINHIPYREMHSSNQISTKMQHPWLHQTFDDNISVNTLILEELCINENTGKSPEIIDVEAICDDSGFRCNAIQAKKSSNLKNTIVTEKTNAASVMLDAERRNEKEENDVDMETNNDINIKEIYQKEIQRQKSQESVKTQASRCINRNPSKHNASKNIQDEIQAKRTKFQEEDSKDSNVVIAPQPLSDVKKADLKSPPSIPKIVSVESVHYNIVPTSKSVRQPSILSNSMFSPMHLECCNSMSSFSLMSKVPSSLHDGSLCNYKLSPTSDISVTYANNEMDIQMVPPLKYTSEQNENQSDDKELSFAFSGFKKPMKGNFTLF